MNLDSPQEKLHKQRKAAELEEPVEEARDLALRLGLDPYPVNYWIVDHDEMNQLIAYGGFQKRYPHWRWGMTYDKQQKQGQVGGGKAFEIVNNDSPSQAFLQESNTLADQKAVITHVEGHADFFRNNNWFHLFGQEPNASAMMERHADRIKYIMDEEADGGRDEVGRFIDANLVLEDNIDQRQAYKAAKDFLEEHEEAEFDADEWVEGLGLTDPVKEAQFTQEYLEELEERREAEDLYEDPVSDVLAYLRVHGKQFDDETGKAVDREPWQNEVMDMLRTEAYYFAAQKMTKFMNEGWAAYWESKMMGEENFADSQELVTYADHQARVLNSPGLNPYKIGKTMWEHIENDSNAREVMDKLLRVDGVEWDRPEKLTTTRVLEQLKDQANYDEIIAALEPGAKIDRITADSPQQLQTAKEWSVDGVAAAIDEQLDADAQRYLEDVVPHDERIDYESVEEAVDGDIDVEKYPWKLLTHEGLAERHYSLVKPQNNGVLANMSRDDIQTLARLAFETDVYDSVEDALADVDRKKGWNTMREIMETHNDTMYFDNHVTVDAMLDSNMFSYEHMQQTGQYHATSDPNDIQQYFENVKKKLMLQFTNFGKPTVAVYDGNFDNKNELLLGHEYNGVQMNINQAARTLERTYELWGRPVNLATIVKEYDEDEAEVAQRRGQEPEAEEVPKLLRYDPEAENPFTLYEMDDKGAPSDWKQNGEELMEYLEADDVDYDTKPEEWLA